MNQVFTKIVATIGPASRDYTTVKNIIESGASVIRLNFSHETFEAHEKTLNFAREAAKELGRSVAVFQDLQGPKIRIGELPNGPIKLKEGTEFIITTEQCEGNEKRVSIDYPMLHKEAKPGNKILIDDGLIGLEVTKVSGNDIYTKVVDPGLLKPRKGVNLPHIKLSGLSSFTEKDEKDLEFAFTHDIDYVALSFVRTHYDVRALKDYMVRKYSRTIPVIAKIEKPEAVEDLDCIIEETDAIMVARGDLGVETSPEDVPMIQKTIINRCNVAGLPVITATQMLESMIENPRPTRAEAGDVANAILDGTSAVMLSGETAAGTYPVESVKMMRKIAVRTETSTQFKTLVFNRRSRITGMDHRQWSATEAVGVAARELAVAIHAKYIVSFTHSGGTAVLISKAKPPIPTIALSPIDETVQRLNLAWGIIPVKKGELKTIDDLLYNAPQHLMQMGLVNPGDYIVITAGVPVGKPGKTNMIKVVQIEP
ncbi:MAG: pyruvate kinase [Spirochaetia bacterium]